MTHAALEALLLVCAPNVAPSTMHAIIQAESAGNPHAVNINGPWLARASSAVDAARAARWALSKGYSVDLGLMQVNSRNLHMLGLTIEQALEPCTNLRAGAAILSANYATAAERHGPGQAALLAAISAYNTGNHTKGFSNGYVARVVAKHRQILRARDRYRSARQDNAREAAGVAESCTSLREKREGRENLCNKTQPVAVAR